MAGKKKTSKKDKSGDTGEKVANESKNVKKEEKKNAGGEEASGSGKSDEGNDEAVSEVINEINREDGEDDSGAAEEDFQASAGGRPVGEAGGDASNIDLLMDVNVTVRVELGRTRKTIEDILKLSPGMLVELERSAGENVDLYLNDKLFATGEVTVVGGNFAIKINSLVSKTERLRASM